MGNKDVGGRIKLPIEQFECLHLEVLDMEIGERRKIRFQIPFFGLINLAGQINASNTKLLHGINGDCSPAHAEHIHVSYTKCAGFPF